MQTDYQILYLEERAEDMERVAALLKREYLPVEMTWVQGWEAFQSALTGGWGFDLLLVGDAPGNELIQPLILAQRTTPDLPVILLSQNPGEDSAADWLHHGGTDWVPKANLARLAPAIRRAMKESQTLAALRQAEAARTRVVGLLRTVLATTSDGILVTDLAGKITTYNRKFMALCGIPEYVMAPMELDRVLAFLQDQFTDSEAFLREARLLGSRPEQKPLGRLNGGGGHLIEAYGRPQRLGSEMAGKIFRFMDVTESGHAGERSWETSAVPPDLLDAARAGRVVPWYLTEHNLVISEKALKVLGLPPEALPRDLAALEALIRPADLDRFRQALEQPRTAPFELTLRRGDGTWVRTRWNVKRGTEGYRGIFSEAPAPAQGGDEAPPPDSFSPRFSFKVKV